MIKSRVTDILVSDQRFAIVMDIEQTARFAAFLGGRIIKTFFLPRNVRGTSVYACTE